MREDSAGRKEGGRERRSFPPVPKKKKEKKTWITSILIWDVVIQGGRTLGRNVDRDRNKRQLRSDSETEVWMRISSPSLERQAGAQTGGRGFCSHILIKAENRSEVGVQLLPPQVYQQPGCAPSLPLSLSLSLYLLLPLSHAQSHPCPHFPVFFPLISSFPPFPLFFRRSSFFSPSLTRHSLARSLGILIKLGCSLMLSPWQQSP